MARGIGTGLLALGSITLVAAAGVVATVVLVVDWLPRWWGRAWLWALAGLAEDDEFRSHACRRSFPTSRSRRSLKGSAKAIIRGVRGLGTFPRAGPAPTSSRSRGKGRFCWRSGTRPSRCGRRATPCMPTGAFSGCTPTATLPIAARGTKAIHQYGPNKKRHRMCGDVRGLSYRPLIHLPNFSPHCSGYKAKAVNSDPAVRR